MVEVESRRGVVRGAAQIGDIIPGLVFIPFHYGYWDDDEEEHDRAANELTIPIWDPVSKQPHYKYAAVRISTAGKKKENELSEVVKKIKDKLNL
jgi:anaerobic selenocysteine-containing dehydrogenase